MASIVLTAGRVRLDVRHPGCLLVDVSLAFGDLPTVHGWAELCITDDGEWVRTDRNPSGAGWTAPPIARWLTACDAPTRAKLLRAIESTAAAAVMPKDEARACAALDAWLVETGFPDMVSKPVTLGEG